MKGLGRVFKRGSVFWIAYYHRGIEYRESSYSESEARATKLLKKRIGEIGRGRLIGPVEEKVTFEEMAQDLLRDYETNGKRSVSSARLSIRHLTVFFGLDRALDIATDRVRAYISSRQEDESSNGSINRELAALKRMFSLAMQAEKLSSKPYIPSLEESNARQGFLDHGSFLALREALSDYLKDPVTFLYLSGWRVNEMRVLEWRDVDLAGGVVRLRPEISKNKNGRVLPLKGELLEIIEIRARKIQRFLTQPFFVAETFTGQEGKYVPLRETVRGFSEILAGQHDDLPEQAFYMVGTIEEAVEKAAGMQTGE